MPDQLASLSLTSAAEVERLLESLYRARLGGQDGVMHIAAVWERAPGELVSLRINEVTPRSAHDELALRAARARADGIVTTGKILREEPALVHDLGGPAAEGLMAWRREVLGKTEPPFVLILTAGHHLPVEHPALRGWAVPIIYTTRDGAQRLESQGLPERVRVIGIRRPNVRSAIAYLRDELGCASTLVEAGASTTRGLYDSPGAIIDELLLSVYRGKAVPERAQGTTFLPPERIAEAFLRRSPGFEVEEPDGPWRFYRYTRPRPPRRRR